MQIIRQIVAISAKEGEKKIMEDQPIYKYEKRLDSMKSARQFQAKAIVKYDQGEISADKLRAISTAMNTLLRALEQSDLERRLEEIENILNSRHLKGA